MAEPLLEIKGLKTHFFTKDGVARAVDGVSCDVAPGEVLGLVGESCSGKTVTGFSILGLIDPPGRIAGGKVLFKGEDLAHASPERLRALRGTRIAMIFQDPMMTLNPVLRIDTQMIEAVQQYLKEFEGKYEKAPWDKICFAAQQVLDAKSDSFFEFARKGDDTGKFHGVSAKAEANRLIVLYPQVRESWWPFNPRGCWDWWGYSGALYHTKQGPQVRAVMAMVERLSARQ